LYVLDPAGGGTTTRVLVVDLASRMVIRTLEAGYNPQLAVSPDGRRLYIADTRTDGRTASDRLRAVDTATWATVAEVAAPQRLLYIVWGMPAMAVSPDGARLYVQKYSFGPSRPVEYWVDVFDTRTNAFLRERVDLPGCGYGVLLPAAGPLATFCYESNDLRLVDPATAALPGQAAPAGTRRVALTGPVAGAVAAAGHVYAVTVTGQVHVVDAARGVLRQTVGLGAGSEGIWVVPHGKVAVSPDGAHLYVGVGTPDERSQGMASEIRDIDTRTWQQVGVLRPTARVYSFHVGQDGRHLFTASPWHESVAILDLTSGQEIGSLAGLGGTPTWAVPAY
jgi:DNA-binding beta-propeller fold protein YncE